MTNTSELNYNVATLKGWVNQYSDNLYSWAYYKTSNKEIAEDLVQETFVVAIQSFQKFEEKSHPKTWLFSILNHKIIDYYRQNFRKPMVNESSLMDKIFDNNGSWNSEERPNLWSDETEHLLDNSEFQSTLVACMKKLPDNWLVAVQLKYLSEKDTAIICHELQVTTTNFWQMIHRAKLQLRKCLELNWFKK